MEFLEAPYALPYVEETWNYEKSSGANAVHTSTAYEYDDFGNCTKIIQDFGGGETLVGVIEYDNSDSDNYIIGLPTEIYVYGTDGKLLRRRSG